MSTKFIDSDISLLKNNQLTVCSYYHQVKILKITYNLKASIKLINAFKPNITYPMGKIRFRYKQNCQIQNLKAI